jgi:hypothetical protein
MGEVVRYMGEATDFSSAPRYRRQERHFVAVPKHGVVADVLSIHRGGGYGWEAAKESDLPAKRGPEVSDPCPILELSIFLVAADCLPKGRKVQKTNAHGRSLCGPAALADSMLVRIQTLTSD